MKCKRLAMLLVLCSFGSGALASASYGQAKYVGGNIQGLSRGTTGKLDLSSPTAITFEAGSRKIEIPFDEIDGYEYTTDVAHHLGVLPFIVVSLLRARQRVHRIRIDFNASENLPQTAILEIPKSMPQVVLAVLQIHESHCAARQTACSIPRPVRLPNWKTGK